MSKKIIKVDAKVFAAMELRLRKQNNLLRLYEQEIKEFKQWQKRQK